MIDTIVAKVKGFLLSPVETFRQSKADEPQAVFTYFAILLLLNAILSAIISVAGFDRMASFGRMMGTAATPHPVIVFFGILIGGFILTLVFAAWLHLWVYILGGRKGIMQTVNTVLYASTPRLLLGWIPLISAIFVLWTIVLGVLGIRELQELSPGKAIAAVVIAIIIPLILVIIIAAWFFTTFMMGGSGFPMAPRNFM
jgi:hypothetical protein